MIVNYTTTYQAATVDEAVAKGTAKWQALVGKPDAELPWNATLTITDTNGSKEVELVVSTDVARPS